MTTTRNRDNPDGGDAERDAPLTAEEWARMDDWTDNSGAVVHLKLTAAEIERRYGPTIIDDMVDLTPAMVKAAAEHMADAEALHAASVRRQISRLKAARRPNVIDEPPAPVDYQRPRLMHEARPRPAWLVAAPHALQTVNHDLRRALIRRIPAR